MLFYAALLLTSLILTLVILWIHKLIVVVTRTVFRTNLHNEMAGSTVQFDKRRPGTHLPPDARPWGTYGHSNPETEARTHPVLPDRLTPWGWPVNHQETDDYHPKPVPSHEASPNTYLSSRYVSPRAWQLNVDRPDRDDRPAFLGRVHGEGRNVASKDFQHKQDSKPWGW